MGAVIEKGSGRIAGLAGAQPLGVSGDLEIGWWLSRVVAIIDPGNEASVRVARRLGMQYDGRYTGAQLTHRLKDILVDLFYRERGA